jgi:hypothetical protein
VRARVALGVSPVEVSALVEPDGNSADIGEGLYGGFSFSPITCPASCHSRMGRLSEVTTPMMLVMPELQELCGESVPPRLMVHLEVDYLGPTEVASIPPSS